jgi:hypothetical protein
MMFFLQPNNEDVICPLGKKIVRKLKTLTPFPEDTKNFFSETKLLSLNINGRLATIILLGECFLKVHEREKKYTYRHLKDAETIEKRFVTEDIVRNTSELLLLDAYEYLCKEQENYFQILALKNKPYVPYLLSDFEKSFPRLLPLTPQSMKYLKVNKDTYDCIPCKEGHERYLGYNKFSQHDREQNKNVGYCVQTLEDLLSDLGVEDFKDLPWFVQWVGVAETAQKRLDDFKKTQQRYYDNGDNRYDMVNYYVTVVQLSADIALKKWANYTLAYYKNKGKKVERLFEQDEIEKTSWGQSLQEFAKQAMASLGSKIMSLTTNVGVILYKVVSLLLNHPTIVQLLTMYVEKYFDELCESIAIYNTKQKIRRDANEIRVSAPENGVDMIRSNRNDTVLERFNYERGTWHKLSDEEKAKIVEEKKKLDSQVWDNKVWTFYEILSGFISDGKWKDLIEDMQALHSNSFSTLFDLLTNVPLIGTVFKKVGKGQVRLLAVGYLRDQGNVALKRIVKRANNLQRVTKLATTFYQTIQIYRGKCDSTPLTLYNGISLGKELTTRYNVAFQNAMFNVPYYAMMVLAEEGFYEISYRQSVNREVFIEECIKSTIVGGSLKKQDKLNQELADKQKSEGWKAFLKIIQSIDKNRGNQQTLRQYVIENNIRAVTKQDQLFGNEPSEWLKKLKEEKESYNLFYKGAAVAVVLGATLCYLNPACATGAVAVATAVANATLQLINVLYEKWNQIKDILKPYYDYVLNGTVLIKDKAASILGGIATTISDKLNLKVTVEILYKFMEYVSKTEIGIRFLQQYAEPAVMIASEQIYRAGAEFLSSTQDFVDRFKGIPLQDILDLKPVYKSVFKSRLREMINKFAIDMDKDKFMDANSKRNDKYKKVQKLLEDKKTVKLAWIPQYSNLNLEAVETFFQNYEEGRTNLN